jgi:hypothetical protein
MCSNEALLRHVQVMIVATPEQLLASYRSHGTILMGYKRSPLFKILIISTSLSLKARFISILTLTYVVLQPHMDSTVNKTESNILLPTFPNLSLFAGQ